MPTNPGSCDSTTNNANKTIAAARVPLREFDPVPNVAIKSVTGTAIVYSAIGNDGVRRDRGPVTWGDETKMWAYCPSSLPSTAVNAAAGNPGPPPAVNARGTLYLENAYRIQIDVAPAPGVTTPKFPSNLGANDGLSGELEVELKSVSIEGVLLLADGTQRDVTLDLLDRALVVAQTVSFSDGSFDAQVTGRGREALGLRHEDGDIAVIMPTHLNVHAKQLATPLGTDAHLALMDGALAPRRQTLVLDGSPAKLRLTQAGFALFVVVFTPT